MGCSAPQIKHGNADYAIGDFELRRVRIIITSASERLFEKLNRAVHTLLDADFSEHMEGVRPKWRWG